MRRLTAVIRKTGVHNMDYKDEVDYVDYEDEIHYADYKH